jgi:CheY-like chemotaxis protein
MPFRKRALRVARVLFRCLLGCLTVGCAPPRPGASPPIAGNAATGDQALSTSERQRGCPERVFEGDGTVTDQASLEALAQYTRIAGDLLIADTHLDRMDSLRCLREVSGDVALTGNDRLANLDGLSHLTSRASASKRDRFRSLG